MTSALNATGEHGAAGMGPLGDEETVHRAALVINKDLDVLSRHVRESIAAAANGPKKSAVSSGNLSQLSSPSVSLQAESSNLSLIEVAAANVARRRKLADASTSASSSLTNLQQGARSRNPSASCRCEALIPEMEKCASELRACIQEVGAFHADRERKIREVAGESAAHGYALEIQAASSALDAKVHEAVSHVSTTVAVHLASGEQPCSAVKDNVREAAASLATEVRIFFVSLLLSIFFLFIPFLFSPLDQASVGGARRAGSQALRSGRFQEGCRVISSPAECRRGDP